MTDNELTEVKSDPITLDASYIYKAEDWEDFISLWMVSKEIDIRNQWFKGDIANRVASIHGEGSLKKFAQAVHESSTTIEHYRRVSRAFPMKLRNWNLSWTHYLIASFTDSYKKALGDFAGRERYDWIKKAHDEEWSTTRLQAEIKKEDALIKSDGDVFDYYSNYLTKVRNIMTHMEKESLTDEEKDRLMQKFLEVYNEFAEYLQR